jgi:hypothetical protein
LSRFTLSLEQDKLRAPGKEVRLVGYYAPDNDSMAMARFGDRAAKAASFFPLTLSQAAPRHLFNDRKRQRAAYTAVSSSPFRLPIEEFARISAEYTDEEHVPGRLIYAERFAVDEALVSESGSKKRAVRNWTESSVLRGGEPGSH